MNTGRKAGMGLLVAGVGVFLAMVLAGCGTTQSSTVVGGAAAVNAIGGYRLQVSVDSTPIGATIEMNGRVMGTTPLTLYVEVDQNGYLVENAMLSANFSTSLNPGSGSSGSSGSSSPAIVTDELIRGEPPPSAVTFDTEGSSRRPR